MNIQLYEQVPSKTEIAQAIDSVTGIPHEVYVQFKVMEEVAKQGISKFQKSAIDSFLQAQEGLTKGQVLGVNIQITGERKDVTRKKYAYSKNIDKIEKDIINKECELDYLKDLLKLEQTKEINNGTAREEIFTESEPEKLGLRITLQK